MSKQLLAKKLISQMKERWCLFQELHCWHAMEWVAVLGTVLSVGLDMRILLFIS